MVDTPGQAKHVGLVAAVAGAVIAVTAGSAVAQSSGPADGKPVGTELLWRTLCQTAADQGLSSAGDVAMGYLSRGGAAAIEERGLANAASEIAADYLRDLALAFATQTSGEATTTAGAAPIVDARTAKAAHVFALALVFTGSVPLSLGYVAFSAAADAGVHPPSDTFCEALASSTRSSAGTALIDYLPNINLTVREVPATSRPGLQAVPTQGADLLRFIFKDNTSGP